MGVSLSTARWLAPASFAVDFAAQQYGMLSRPNMKDVHDANLSFFSPQPFFIAGFFFPQQIAQVAWLWRLWRAQPPSATGSSSSSPSSSAVASMVDFAPYYALGNFCIATWMIFWNKSALQTSNVFVIINSLAQLYYVFARLPPLDRGSWDSILTHVVSKTFAGIGVLDLLHNTSVAYAVGAPPSPALRALTGLGFGLLASASDWIFGGCLVYDLVALAVGQAAYAPAAGTGWSRLLGAYAAGAAAIVAVKNWLRPPYTRDIGYQPLEQA
ncbi:hypothetical protein GGR56DRAFT_685402 [Xylariaceae sp. FL0804]|nr:hypothetical protein GGR56DRAFT_685402 [Xylariaceae sp. FL0804]